MRNRTELMFQLVIVSFTGIRGVRNHESGVRRDRENR